MNFSKILAADTAGDAMRKVYERSSMALAALFPLSYMQKEGDGLGRVVDVALGVAVPVHSHIALNYVVSDYVPKGARMPARYAVLASTAVMALGAAKLNVAGPGVSATVKKLWATGKDRKEAAA